MNGKYDISEISDEILNADFRVWADEIKKEHIKPLPMIRGEFRHLFTTENLKLAHDLLDEHNITQIFPEDIYTAMLALDGIKGVAQEKDFGIASFAGTLGDVMTVIAGLYDLCKRLDPMSEMYERKAEVSANKEDIINGTCF